MSLFPSILGGVFGAIVEAVAEYFMQVVLYGVGRFCRKLIGLPPTVGELSEIVIGIVVLILLGVALYYVWSWLS